MTNSEKFLKLYRELETSINKKYSLSIYEFTNNTNSRFINENKSFLDNARQLRNILTHYNEFGESEICEVSNDCIIKMESIITYINNPPSIKDFMVPLSKLKYAKLDGYVNQAIRLLSEKNYSDIPILDDYFKVVGCFNESTILASIYKNQKIELNENTRFSDKYIEPFLHLDNHLTEEFKFISINESIEKVKIIFENNLASPKRLSILFVTKTGKNNEPLLGIVTPWDILGKKRKNEGK